MATPVTLLGAYDRHNLGDLLLARIAARLFAPATGRRAARGEAAALRGRFSRGYLAVQLAAEFGDDATLDALAPQGEADKHAAYVQSWELPGLPGCVAVGEVRSALRTALRADGAALRAHGAGLAARFLDGFKREFEGLIQARR